MKSVKVIAPATAANLGPGFDVFAVALKQPHDIVEVEVKDTPGIEMEISGYSVPTEPRKNTGGYVAMRMLESFRIKDGLRIKLQKNIPPAMGMGSSAASAAGVAYCINKLFDLKLPTDDLIQFASYGEIISAGDAHADNVAGAIQGGFSLVISREPIHVMNLEPPEDMGVVIATPNIEKGSTKLSREAVPREIPIISLRENVGHASLLAIGMATKNIDYIKKGMNDVVVEPSRVRYGIFREFSKLKKLGQELNAGIAGSGAGPSILGIIEKNKREELAKGMKEIFENAGYHCDLFITEVGEGVREV
ncbi:MAG: homoserine kinase [Candidatus Aenigmarchaeota archaeon]|nr:homoserine kinase [Candidatus Aenigmarchaeota archaeon]